MKKPYKKLARRKITFQDSDDQEVWFQAQLGIGNRELNRVTNLTDSQITYRVSLIKKQLGQDHGLRVAWRNGEHPLFQRILKDYHSVMLADLRRNVIPKLVHPTPQAVSIK